MLCLAKDLDQSLHSHGLKTKLDENNITINSSIRSFILEKVTKYAKLLKLIFRSLSREHFQSILSVLGKENETLVLTILHISLSFLISYISVCSKTCLIWYSPLKQFNFLLRNGKARSHNARSLPIQHV